jgi:hypothetical protein
LKLAMVVFFVLCVPFAALAVDAPKTTIQFVDSTQSTIALQTSPTVSGQAEAKFTPGINYSGAADATLCFQFQVQDDKGIPVQLVLDAAAQTEKICFPEKIEHAQIRTHTLEISAKNVTRPLTGLLIAEITQQEQKSQQPQTTPKDQKAKEQKAKGKPQAQNQKDQEQKDQKGPAISVITKPMRLLPPVKSQLSPGLFWVPFGIALACIVVASLLVARFGLFARMGNTTWDFSQSWASNLTVAGTVLTALLGWAGLAEYGKYLSKNSYLCLSVLFAALVSLAPAVYNFTRRSITVPVPDPDDANNVSGVRIEGYVFGFLLASFVTVWAVLGQLFTIAFVMAELVDLGPLPASAGAAFSGLIVVLAVLLLVYVVVTIYFTVKKQVIHHQKWLSLRKAEAASQVQAAAARTEMAAPQVQAEVAKAAAAIDQQKPPLPKWPLL